MTLTDSQEEGASACFGSHHIVITNLSDGDEVSFSLLLVKGQIISKDVISCPFSSDSTIILHNFEGPVTAPPSTVWSIVDSEFKCLVSLEPGLNKFVFEHCTARFELCIRFKPRLTSLCVTPIYIICEGHDGRFQAPETEDNSIDSACERIGVGIRLIQSLIAEKLYECGYGRKTFQLEHDLESTVPECTVFYSKLPVEKAWTMAPSALWEYFGRELMTSHLGSDRRKFVAFISCTRYMGSPSGQRPATYEDILSLTDAHVALGGGGLALFGSACLHTWPCSVEEVVPRFLCTTCVDTSLFMDDSFYRGTYGACFSTTLGSVCHELGHTFDLGHTNDGIMGHGYSNFHLVFTTPSQTLGGETAARRRTQSLPQHSTVSFTLDLNVTCTMSSPLKRPRHKTTSKSSISHKSSSQDEDLSQKDVSLFKRVVKSHTDNSLESQTFKCKDDLTFWSKSCAAFLAFHRWMNLEAPPEYVGRLVFDQKRNGVSSPAGVRVVELRDPGGAVQTSWEFPELQGRRDFLLPSTSQLSPGSSLVAEDSAGNIIKHNLIPLS